MRFDKIFLLFALAYAVVGMVLGIVMASSHNHTQYVTHAHILLVGFMVSFMHAIIHKLRLPNPGRRLAMIQFILHEVAVIVMSIGLGLLCGAVMPPDTLAPFLASLSLAAMVMMIYMVVTARDRGTN
jgi:DMSO/TMAO reductase YedYZ heme-binding membrane subunit